MCSRAGFEVRPVRAGILAAHVKARQCTYKLLKILGLRNPHHESVTAAVFQHRPGHPRMSLIPYNGKMTAIHSVPTAVSP